MLHYNGDLTYIQEKDGASYLPSSAQVSGKTFETNGNEYDKPHPRADIQGAQFGAVPKDDQTPRKGISYLIHRFYFCL